MSSSSNGGDDKEIRKWNWIYACDGLLCMESLLFVMVCHIAYVYARLNESTMN